MTQKTLLTSNNQTVSYSVFGTGVPMVLIHGVGMQAMAWKPQIDFFSQHYQVIAINMAGHNGSDALHQGARLPDFVEWFNNVFEALNLERAIIIGHSMGALIAQGFTVNYPEKVIGSALLNIVFQRDEYAQNAVRERAKCLTNDLSTVETTLNRWFDNNPDEEPIKKLVKEYLLSVDKKGYSITYTAFAHGDDVYADTWSTVLTPVLLLTGEFDANSNPEMSKKLAKMIPNSHLEIIANHRHMVNLTAPNNVNKRIKEWLDNNKL